MRSIVKDKKPNWRQQSAFSEKMGDLELVLNPDPSRKSWAFELVLGMFASCACIFLTFGWMVDSFAGDALRPSLGFFPSVPLLPQLLDQPTTNEAYILFLPSVYHEEYVTSLRVLLYGFKYDEDTRDNRDVVVMTSPQVPSALEDQLRQEGAIISRNELITSIPNPLENIDMRWRDVYSKLHAWNLTQYERVLLLDSDMLMARSMKHIWDEPFARPESGVAARQIGGNPANYPYLDYLNSGFLVAVPNRTMFEELLLVRDFKFQLPGLVDIDQALLNKYFRREGPHPWVPLGEKWVVNSPKKEDLEEGYHMLHEKCWMDEWDRELTSLWRKKLGKMRGFHAARRAMLETKEKDMASGSTS